MTTPTPSQPAVTAVPSSSSSSPFPDAPAPWKNLKAEGFWFLSNNQPTGPGTYDPLEASASFASPDSGAFTGGLLTVMLVRYTDTPVGPYDELILSPGTFHVPTLPNSPKKLRITRIYVSTAASTYNGRRNWNIPKRVASFTFVPSPAGSKTPYSRIEVALPGSDAPFFAANLTGVVAGGLAMPFSTTYWPRDLELVQPPLPRGEEEEREGTEEWVRVKPWMRGKVAGVWGEGGLEGGKWGDGVGIADVGVWGLGVWWKELWVDFPVGVTVGRKDV